MSKEQHMQEVVLGGRRPSLSPILARAPAGVARLLERCWQTNHNQRPDFATIQRDLVSISGDETAATTPSHGNETDSVSRRRAARLSWTTMFQRSNSSGSSSTVHADSSNRSIDHHNQEVASMKVVSKPTAPSKKQGFLGSCLSLKL
eukprot:gene28009-36906_t